ncbi:MAG: carbohydrate porin [Planctomycetes bacterium]|nr:carbohydrate porin [Planctomycetota bacterium]
MLQRLLRAARLASVLTVLLSSVACNRSGSERGARKAEHGSPSASKSAARPAAKSSASKSSRPAPVQSSVAADVTAAPADGVDAEPARGAAEPDANVVAEPASALPPVARAESNEVEPAVAPSIAVEPEPVVVDVPEVAVEPVHTPEPLAAAVEPALASEPAPSADPASSDATPASEFHLEIAAPADAPPPEPLAKGSADAVAEAVAAEGSADDSPFDVSIGATTIYQSLVTGDHGNDALVGYLDIVAEAELAPGTTATLEIESIGGNGPDADVPSFGATVLGWNSNAGSAQDDDGFDRVYLAEAFVSSDVLGHDWVLDFGKVATTSYLDTNRVANNSTGQFLSGSFVNSAATQIPFRGAGIALTYLGSERYDVRLLAVRPDNSGDDATSGVFGGAQVDLFWTCGDELAGSCAVFGWSNGAKDDQCGFGLSLDQDCCEDVTAFARVGWQDEVDVAPQAIDTAWSLGCECRGPFDGRADDVVGVALGMNASHDSALDDETVYELYYKRVFTERFEATLHAQGMNHPGGDPAEDQVTSLGVRLQFNF